MFIGLDLGTSCGWAMLDADGKRLASGTWNLKPVMYQGGGMRPLRLRNHLAELLGMFKVTAVGFEDVRAHEGTEAAHIFGELRGVVGSLCEGMGIPYSGVSVGTIKRTATGKGNAGKPAIQAAALAKWGHEAGEDEADALFVAECIRAGQA